jgi:hypothetical protein
MRDRKGIGEMVDAWKGNAAGFLSEITPVKGKQSEMSQPSNPPTL